MSGKIAIDKLKPHPKNDYYFSDVTGEKYDEIKRSIATYGIRDPLKVTTAYTIVSGHQRYRIAKELGFTEVPVEIVDVDEWQAEYLLIAENVERRGQAETDPIKKSRIAQFLKEYWGVKQGKKGQNAFFKRTEDVAEMIGEDERTTKRLLKLNDLIPEIQALVSAGKLGTTAAEQLAYLSEDEQRALFGDRGRDLSEITVAEAKNLRQEIEKLRKENAELRAKAEKPPVEKVIEKPVVKEVMREVIPEDVQRRIKEAEERARQAEATKRELERSVVALNERVVELESIEHAVKSSAESELGRVKRYAHLLRNEVYPLIENRQHTVGVLKMSDRVTVEELRKVLETCQGLLVQMIEVVNTSTGENIIDVEVLV